ncbi:MAG: hypothetical protein LBU32_12170 [Clostridiales bacterium]|jgi:hypothetical protein|nr:hypothetical protein [Clostridiales bacterium]
MGIFKPLGEMVFGVAGIVAGGGVSLAGSLLNIGLVKEIGEGISKSGIKSGAIVGQAIDGAFGVTEGALMGDLSTLKRGAGEIAGSAVSIVSGAAINAANVLSGVAESVNALADGDKTRAASSAKKAVKTIVVSMFTAGEAAIADSADDGAAEPSKTPENSDGDI